jgi:GT2 family glycosyltransferase
MHRSVYFGDIHAAYLFNVIVFTNSMMFRRSLLQAVGPQLKKFGMFHDLEFALRICRNTRVAFVDIPSYKLRYHPDQISTTRKSSGGKVAIRIQRDLLRVAEHHLRQDPDFYSRNEDRVRKRLARLCRAAAIPLIAFDSGTAQENRRCSLRARHYLEKCREYGSIEAMLYALTYSPHIVRRVAFKLMSIHGAMTAHKRAP